MSIDSSHVHTYAKPIETVKAIQFIGSNAKGVIEFAKENPEVNAVDMSLRQTLDLNDRNWLCRLIAGAAPCVGLTFWCDQPDGISHMHKVELNDYLVRFSDGLRIAVLPEADFDKNYVPVNGGGDDQLS